MRLSTWSLHINSRFLEKANIDGKETTWFFITITALIGYKSELATLKNKVLIYKAVIRRVCMDDTQYYVELSVTLTCGLDTAVHTK